MNYELLGVGGEKYTGGNSGGRKTVLDGVTERKAGSIVLFNEAREPLRWNFAAVVAGIVYHVKKL